MSSLKKYLKKIDFKEILVLSLLALFAFLIIKMIFGGFLGLSFVVIENGPRSSMWPTYDQGDMFLLYAAKPENIQMGDVIVYRSQNPSFGMGDLIIHRVVNITIIEKSGRMNYYYRVSGDNPNTNTFVDKYNSTSTLIPYNAVVGKTVFMLPKIGYLRLWMTQLSIARFVMIGLLVVIALYILFAPEDEKENKDKKGQKEGQKEGEKEEETNVKKETEKENQDTTQKIESTKIEEKTQNSKFNIGGYLENSFNKAKRSAVSLFTNKQKRKKLLIKVAIIIGLIIAIPVLDAIISDRSLDTEIYDLSLVSKPSGIYYEHAINEGIVYVPLDIYFSHDGSWNKVMKSFTILGIQNNKTLSIMEWYSFYQKEGDMIIGGTLILPYDEFDYNTSLGIQIDYCIKRRFGRNEEKTYYKEINLPSPSF